MNLALESSAATWKIVVGHHTIRSLGRHGDTPELVKSVLPILEVSLSILASNPSSAAVLAVRHFFLLLLEDRLFLEEWLSGLNSHILNLLLMFLQSHNVDVYINGHDHCLEHIKRQDR